jgi:hypothetical protein
MNSRAGGADSQFLLADELAVEAELRGYAARVAPMPSAAFMDRVVALAERSPLPVAGRSPRVRATELVHAAATRLRVALAQVAGGPSIPLRVRVQAGAMLVVVALAITAGATLAAAGATTVVTWVAGPQAPAAGSRPSASPTLSPNQSSDTSQRSDHPNGSINPGNGGRPSQNPGNCGQPSQNPGNRPSDHPNASNNPGNGGRPTQSPGSQASDHPNASINPGNGGRPTQIPKPTAAAHP